MNSEIRSLWVRLYGTLFTVVNDPLNHGKLHFVSMTIIFGRKFLVPGQYR